MWLKNNFHLNSLGFRIYMQFTTLFPIVHLMIELPAIKKGED